MAPPMFHVILFQPEIPPNTGNAVRLYANTGAHLHLVKPLGFSLDDRFSSLICGAGITMILPGSPFMRTGLRM